MGTSQVKGSRAAARILHQQEAVGKRNTGGATKTSRKENAPSGPGAFRESRKKSNSGQKIRATAWSELYWVRAWRPAASAAQGHRPSPDRPGRRGGRCPG